MYTVIMKIDGESIERRETSADQFFTKEFGKMQVDGERVGLIGKEEGLLVDIIGISRGPGVLELEVGQVLGMMVGKEQLMAIAAGEEEGID